MEIIEDELNFLIVKLTRNEFDEIEKILRLKNL